MLLAHHQIWCNGRNLARHLVSAEDHIIEIGSSLGHCTEVLHARAADVLGLDVSVAQLAESRRRVPGAEFEFLDVFEEPDRLAALPAAARCTKVFLDIGGDRQKVQVLNAIGILRRCLQRARLIVVKSEELHAAMASWMGCTGNGEGILVCS
ncbi:tam [Symbiodinium natans]|uniref:Tam protein n=1 Tax=Symbiodinium natans TaxID=878477 RepID=A0A812RU52_9DINO|nr:tam [Symbiodinium natans]